MSRRSLFLVWVVMFVAPLVPAEEAWKTWPPREYLLKSLVEAVPGYLKAYHPESGKFGSEPWVCQDQNVIYPLAAVWSIQDPKNPFYHDEKILEAIAGGGEALVDEMDKDGKWTFRKKDNSTWGHIHMPWTYSRWIRAYQLVKDILPENSRKKWEEGLRLGFSGIRKHADDASVHNIPTHHAMALYIAGMCFENEDWKNAADAFLAKVIAGQDPAGFWSEHFGPVVGYNMVYVEALGVYYHFSKAPIVLDALGRSARFHASVLWPDGSCVAAIDERQIYHSGISTGNVGFTWTPEGRGFLLKQLAAYSQGGAKLVDGDYAASMLLYGGSGEAIPPAGEADASAVVLGKNDALIQRNKPWQWALSGYACTPSTSRWIQDRQNFVDVYHDDLGLVMGGGNTKLQPYWSTFTVGDTSLLRHKPGEESPNFTPEIDLAWTPDAASIARMDADSTLTLRYDEIECRVIVNTSKDGTMRITYAAPKARRIEGHVPFLNRAKALTTASGKVVPLTEEDLVMNSGEMGGHIVYGGLKVSIPEGSAVRWPARQHNPYKKDGRSSLAEAKLVLVLPFDSEDTYTILLSHMPESVTN